jgi:homoserine dehydrogenase
VADASDPSPVRVAVLGCGNVGTALVELLTDPERAAEIALRTGAHLDVVGIAVQDLARRRGETPGFPHHLLTDDAKGLVEREDVDVVVELIGGLDPARELVEAALAAGRPVVTANKALLARSGAELSALAAANGVDLLYEAAVAGAIPVIRPLRESLAGERIVKVMGIVNGTTNFILTKMADDGSDYGDALVEAQRLGLAERDPTADVEGIDAAAKAAILASLAFGADVVAADVDHEGITGVRSLDVAFAERMGYVIKLLAVAELLGDGPEVSVRVHPAMVPRSHPLATVAGAMNAVFVVGEISGELMLYGQGAGGRPTAGAVLGDLVDAARHLRLGTAAPAPSRRMPVRFRPAADLRSAFYLSIDVLDRPGVLAAVATVFGDHGVSIRSMEQVGLGAEARLVFLTHVAREGAVMETLEGLAGLTVVDRVGGVLRVVGDESDGGPETAGG